MASYVGIDLHRRRSVIVVLNEGGERVWSSRTENSRLNLGARAAVVGRAGRVGTSLTAPLLGIRAGQPQRGGRTTCAARRQAWESGRRVGTPPHRLYIRGPRPIGPAD